MNYQQKESRGSLFRNSKSNDRQPDLKGSILIGGITYNLSGWNRTSQSGNDYISLVAEVKRDTQTPVAHRPAGTPYPEPVRTPDAFDPETGEEYRDLPF